MSILSWLRGERPRQEEFEDSDYSEPAPFVIGPGALDPRSPTWLFVRNWANEELRKAREKNDSANRDIVQTSMLRGEIKAYKALINLPNPSKGLLIEEE